MVTVPGAGSVNPTLTAGTNQAVAQQAAAIIGSALNVQSNTMTSGGSAPAIPQGDIGELVVNANNGANIAAQNYRFFVIGDTLQPVTVTAGGALAQAVILGNGPITFNTGGGSGTIVGGDGNKVVNTGNGTNFAVFTGAGNDTVNLGASPAAGRNTVEAGAGSNTITLGAAPTQLRSIGADTINIGTGSTTVQAIGNASVSLAGGNAPRTFVNGSGSSTVQGGLGAATVIGGVGGGQFYGGSAGNNLLIGGSGNAYLTGGGTGDVLIATSANAAQYLLAGAGNETLLGSLSTMNNTFAAGAGADLIIAGAGNDTIVAGSGAATVSGGGGADVFRFNTLVARGGSMTITDFAPGTDHVSLVGYADSAASLAAAAQLVAPATSRVTLSDGTSITFIGIGSVKSSFFS